MDLDGVKKAAAWFGTAVAVALTLAQSFIAFSLWALVIGITLAAFCAPPVREWLDAHRFPELDVKPFVLVFSFIALVQYGFTLSAESDAKKEQERVAAFQRAERVERAKQEDLSFYRAHKEQVLSEIRAKQDRGEFDAAREQARRYHILTADPALASELKAIDATEARHTLKNEAGLSLEVRARLYKVLAESEPESAALQKKAATLGKELEAEVAAKAAENARIEALATRRANIAKQFSPWDGSHIELERAVKAMMKNPRSYEHARTTYRDTGKSIVVTMTYRGTNSFGAVVPSTVQAEFDDAGNVIKARTVK